MNDQYLTMSVILGIALGLFVGMFIIAIACAILSFLSYSKVVGFENSTHKIEYHNPFPDAPTPEVPEEDYDFNPYVRSEKDEKAEEEARKQAEKYAKEQDKFMKLAFGSDED